MDSLKSETSGDLLMGLKMLGTLSIIALLYGIVGICTCVQFCWLWINGNYGQIECMNAWRNQEGKLS